MRVSESGARVGVRKGVRGRGAEGGSCDEDNGSFPLFGNLPCGSQRTHAG